MIDSVIERLNSVDITNFSLFLLSESKQFNANIIALAPVEIQETLLNRLSEDKRAAIKARADAITSVSEYSLELIQFALDDFESRFKSKNHFLK